jgi:hypothetical protein
MVRSKKMQRRDLHTSPRENEIPGGLLVISVLCLMLFLLVVFLRWFALLSSLVLRRVAAVFSAPPIQLLPLWFLPGV